MRKQLNHTRSKIAEIICRAASTASQAHYLYSLQAAKCYDKARYAFERAATGQERQSSPWQAGKLLEQAASCAKETGDMTQVAELSRLLHTAYFHLALLHVH